MDVGREPLFVRLLLTVALVLFFAGAAWGQEPERRDSSPQADRKESSKDVATTPGEDVGPAESGEASQQPGPRPAEGAEAEGNARVGGVLKRVQRKRAYRDAVILGLRAFGEGDAAEARKHFARALEIRPDGPEARVGMRRSKVGLFGARAGLLVPLGEANHNYPPAFGWGIQYRRLVGRRRFLEAWLSFASLASTEADMSTNVFASGVGVLLPLGGKGFCLLGGCGLLSDAASSETREAKHNVGFTLDLGLGLVQGSCKRDIRLGFSFLLGSENVPVLMGITGGVAF